MESGTTDSSKQRALFIYLSEIKNLDPYTPEEEVDLARRAKKGDRVAYNKLITHNLRFVVAVARKFQNHGLPLEDLINEGNLGLIKAVNRFDETRGFRFISYAVWWIRQSIRQAIAKTGRVVRLPINMTENMGTVYQRAGELEQAYEREPTVEELAEINEKTIGEMEDLLRNFQFPTSLDEPLSESTKTLLDYLVTGDPRPETEIMKESIHHEIDQLVEHLDEREAYILVHYFGLDENSYKTLDELGYELNISRERVRQIKNNALKRLRKSTNSSFLRLYLS